MKRKKIKNMSIVYKCSDLINKKRVINELDFIQQDNKISNPIYAPAIVCYEHNTLTDTSLLVNIGFSKHVIFIDTECDKLSDFLIGVGSLEYNDIYCSILRNKNRSIDSAKKRKDWKWYSVYEDMLEDISDNINSEFSFLLPAIYKNYTKRGINLLKINNTYLVLQPTIVISTIDNF